jgi:hypothetical protein
MGRAAPQSGHDQIWCIGAIMLEQSSREFEGSGPLTIRQPTERQGANARFDEGGNMSEDGIRRMYFTGDPNDPEATEKWAEEVIDTLEKIQQGPLPWLPGGATREGLADQLIRSEASDWEVVENSRTQERISLEARHRLNPDFWFSMLANPQAGEEETVAHFKLIWYRRLVHSDRGVLGEDGIVLPHPEPSRFSFTDKRKDLWRLVHDVWSIAS